MFGTHILMMIYPIFFQKYHEKFNTTDLWDGNESSIKSQDNHALELCVCVCVCVFLF